MIQLHNISKTYNDNLILNHISFSIQPKEVVALIGKNGAGKTTLFRLITGEIAPDSGTINRDSCRIGYLPQQIHNQEQTAAQYIESRTGESAHKLTPYLAQTGLATLDISRKIKTLSGGQQTRLGLAVLLSRQPNLLLLDEPTNNLDSEGLAWLTGFIHSFSGAILLTSHDRAFLDSVATRTLVLEAGDINQYGGNYSFFQQQRQAERASAQAKYQENRDEIKRLEQRIVERKEQARRKASNTKPARDNDKFAANFFAQRSSRKVAAQANALESRLNQLERIESPRKIRRYPVELSGANDHNRLIVRAINLSKSFHNQPILSHIHLALYGQERVHIAGPNGAGKSTLLRIIARQLQPDAGELDYGPAVRIGYLSQDTSLVDRYPSGLAALQATNATDEQCYKQAKSLGLTPTDLAKPIIELSRGQQTKLAVAQLILQENDLLILDEPTNHLDIESRELIEATLEEYAGAIIVASHDQYFLKQIDMQRTISLK